MRIARITAGCIAASLIPLTIAATPSVAAPTTAPTAKVKFRAPQGPALVRIDAPSATVVAKNPAAKSFTLTLNDPKKVRWMGEVKDSRGQQRLGYGELPASQLAASWKTLGNSANGVLATLTWNTRSADPGYALVRLRTPAVKSRQVAASADQSRDSMTATITALGPIPKSLTDVSLNVNRSAGKQNRAYATTTFYVTNQIQNPVAQLFALCIEQLEGYKAPPRSYATLQSEFMEKLKDEEEATLAVLEKKERQLEGLMFLKAPHFTGQQTLIGFFAKK